MHSLVRFNEYGYEMYLKYEHNCSVYRRHLEERDTTGQHALQWEKQYEELRYMLAKSLFPDSVQDGRSHEKIMRRVICLYTDKFQSLYCKISF